MPLSQADKLFKDGRRAADRRDYVQACKLFEQSFRLDPGVGTLINLGDCAEHLGDLEHAYESYRTASARMVEGDDRLPRVQARIETIDQRSAKVALRLESDAPTETVISVDGVTVEPEKTPLHLAKGAHVILVTAVGYGGTRYSVTVAEGEIRALPVSPGAPLDVTLPTSRQPTTTRNPGMRPLAIASLGTGVAAVWVGSLAGLMAIDRRDVQRANCNAQSACNQVGVDAAHDGASWASASTVMFVVGAALIAVGGTFLVLSLSSSSKRATATLTANPLGLFVAGQFQ